MPERHPDQNSLTLGPFYSRTEWFFLETLMDLEQRINASDEYNTIRAAGLLRQLLLDKVPLIVAANKETKLKLRFNIPEQAAQSAERPFLAWMPLKRSEKMESVNRDGLLRRVVLMFHEYDFTVKDVINAVANLRGGVHIDKPRKIQEAAINALNEFFTVLHSGGAVVTTVKGIGSIVLDGTIPLVEAIRKRTTVELVPVPGQNGVFKSG